MTDREHGTSARYHHGPDEHDAPGNGCRCRRCSAAGRREAKKRALLIARGEWEPYVPADRAREHVQWLAEHGIGYRQVTKLAGISHGAMCKLLYGGPGDRPPSRRIRHETEDAILAVRPVPANLAVSALTDATGTRRRLQALVAAGWPQRWLAARLGKDWKEFYEMMRRPQVEAATVRAVAGLYDELWDQQPPQRTAAERNAVRNARSRAEKRGWALPAAWDDDAIDDPEARAEDCRRRGRRPLAVLVEEARELIEEQGYTREFAAERLGVSRESLDKAMERTRKAAA